jgi:DNA-binding response OmpR family regulator
MTSNATLSSAGKPSILVIEDEPEIVEVLSELLGQAGYHVMSADRVSRAAKMLANQRFSCVTVDLRLAQGSGEQIIAHMRNDRQGYNRTTPVVVISSHLTRDLVAKIGNLIQGAVAKPFRNDELVAKVAKLCPIDPVAKR